MGRRARFTQAARMLCRGVDEAQAEPSHGRISVEAGTLPVQELDKLDPGICVSAYGFRTRARCLMLCVFFFPLFFAPGLVQMLEVEADAFFHDKTGRILPIVASFRTNVLGNRQSLQMCAWNPSHIEGSR